MGQYFRVVNVDKREFLEPRAFREGPKLMELAHGGRMLRGLAVILSNGNGRGGGDIDSADPLVGSWAGDRIVVAGDYGDEGKWTGSAGVTLYAEAGQTYTDISDRVVAMLDKAGEL